MTTKVGPFFRFELFLHHHGVAVDAEEDVAEFRAVQRRFHLVQLVLGEFRKGFGFLVGIAVSILERVVGQVVSDVVRVPKLVSVDDADVHRMADKLVAVILVAQGGCADLALGERIAEVQVNVSLPLLDAQHDALQVLVLPSACGK